MKSIKFTTETPWPDDRVKSKDEQMMDGMEWCQFITLDIVPRKGDLVDIGGDYLEVREFYINPQEGGVTVLEAFVDGDSIGETSHAGMIAAGWQEL